MAINLAGYYIDLTKKRNMSYKPIALLLSTSIALCTASYAQITPTGITLGPSQQQQFSMQGQQVTWILSPAGTGTITQTGLYTAPSFYSSSSTYVYVYAHAGSDYYQTEVLLSPTPVNLSGSSNAPSVSISVSPTSTNLYAGQSTQFYATVTGTNNQQVSWSITQGVGSIVNGLYTAPSSVSADTLVTISATSLAAPTQTASATILLGPAIAPAAPTPPPATVAISLSPTSVSLNGGQSKQFTATVTGTTNTAVTWSLSPNVGTVNSGLYNAPATVGAAQSITITATSTQDTTQTATATINLVASSVAPPPPTVVSIGLAPTTASLTVGQSQQFSASVSGTTNTAVTWSLVPNVGTILNGLYTPPATIATQQAVTVMATSVADTTKTASAAMQLQPPPAAATTGFTPIAVRCGGGQYVDSQGLVWAADHGYSGTTRTYSNGAAITGTTSPALYQDERWGNNFQYSFSVPNGTYTVTLKLAELYFSAAGARVFSVVINNQPALTNFDIFAQAGGQYKALDESFNVPVSNGQITIQFSSSVNNAKIDAIEILQGASQTPPPPPPATSVSPATATVAPSGTTQFSVQNLPSGTAVAWSLSTATGSITSAGVYTAPSSVASQQTITVTAKDSSTQSVLGTASLTLTASPAPPPPPPTSVSPTTATVAPSGTKQFSVQNLPSGATVIWSISPTTGGITQAGLYTAPSTVATQTTVTVMANNASTNASLGTATVTLTASPAPPPPSTTITSPIEVIGPNGTTSTVSFTVPQGTNLTGQLQLSMTIHGLRYQTEASVKVNNSAWLPINSSTVTLAGLADAYGGIGGGFHTLTMTMNLPAGVVTTGSNTITFQFIQTNGRVSGYRVLAFNVLASNGNALIPASTFVEDDPTTWQPPSSASSDITAGQTLWHTAALTTPTTSGPVPLQAHCADCHSEDGRDLKYFNYSNNTIVGRALFHGLTAQQGNQIASYIRTLNAPSPGRPWNPPYQPGPGLDSQPVSDWSAGAGIDAVLSSDRDMLPFVSPTLTSADFNANGNLSARETPVAFQLPDWNSWLPGIHPLDAFGSQFTGSSPNTDYATLRSELVPNSASAYENAKYLMGRWPTDRELFAGAFTPASTSAAWSNPTTANQLYSIAQWQNVKMWELNQEFGLEGMAQSVFGPQADSRAWYTNSPFFTAPFVLKIPDTASGILNGSVQTSTYLTFVWYYVQMILNNSEKRQQCGASPIDWGYFEDSVIGMSDDSPPQAMTMLTILLKGLQISQDGLGPQYGCQGGWNWQDSVPSRLVQWEFQPMWVDIPASTRASLLNAYTSAWFAVAGTFTPQQFYQGGITPSDPVSPGNPAPNFASAVAYMIPILQYWGVNTTLTQTMEKWAAAIWPSNGYNWASTLTATCTATSDGRAGCQTGN
jgi:hypothetical protein